MSELPGIFDHKVFGCLEWDQGLGPALQLPRQKLGLQNHFLSPPPPTREPLLSSVLMGKIEIVKIIKKQML